MKKLIRFNVKPGGKDAVVDFYVREDNILNLSAVKSLNGELGAGFSSQKIGTPDNLK